MSEQIKLFDENYLPYLVIRLLTLWNVPAKGKRSAAAMLK